MANKIIITTSASEGTPSAGTVSLRVDPTTKKLVGTDDTGTETAYDAASALSDAQIKVAYENNADTNAFDDSEQTKLAAIEALADVTDSTNVTAAGALMDSECSDVAALKATTASFLLADETKLDNIEALADVTDSTNVASAGAVMEADTSTALMSFVLDEDTLVSDSPTKLATQQSIKAYVDAASGGATDLDGLTDAINDTSSLFLGTNAGLVDDGTANLNTGVGTGALKTIVSGAGATAVGANALKVSTVNFGTAIGFNAGVASSTAEYTCAIGANSMTGITTATGSTGVGGKALQYGNAVYGTAVGYSAGAYLGGWGNTSVGVFAGNGATYTTSRYCTAVGFESLKSMTNGSEYNVAIGDQSGKLVSSGKNNLFLGTNSGNTTTIGSNNVLIGDVQNALAADSSKLNIASCLFGDILNGSLSIGSSTQEATALLTITSTTQGVLPPRMTTAQKNAISTPATGLIVFDTDLGTLEIFSGSWVSLSPALPRAVTTISTNTTITNTTDRNIKVDTSGGDVTITLPDCATATGTFDIWKSTTDTNKVFVIRAGSDNIHAVTSVDWNTPYKHVEFVPDGGTLWLMK